jgi:hypothetical protein
VQSLSLVQTIISALTLVIVGASATLALLQIRKTQDWNRRKASQDLLLQVVTGELVSLRQLLEIKYEAEFARMTVADCSSLLQRLSSEERREFAFVVKRLFNYLEAIAIGIKNNVFDEEICYEHLSIVATRYWKWAKPFVDEVRAVSPVIWIEIEHFVNGWSLRLEEDLRVLRRAGKPRT